MSIVHNPVYRNTNSLFLLTLFQTKLMTIFFCYIRSTLHGKGYKMSQENGIINYE